jgi:hypothetical protein
MADSPCTKCGEKCNGKLFFAYVNYYEEQELIKRRLRICQACVFDFFAPLIELSDRQSNWGNWIPAEGEKQWPIDAVSAITNHARLVNGLSTQPTKTTVTSTVGAATESNLSAENAGSPAPSQAQRFSKQSTIADSAGTTGNNSANSLTNTSQSESTSHSRSRPHLKTKSTGSSKQ